MKFLHKLSQKKNIYIQWMVSGLLAATCIFCLVLKEIDNHGFVETYFKNNNSQIDVIINAGKNVEMRTDMMNNITYPSSLKNELGQGLSVNPSISRYWQNFEITIIPSNDGIITLRLLGPDKCLNNERLPIIVAYRNFKINDKSIEMKNKRFWHTNPFNYSIKIQKDIPVKISVDIKIPIPTFKEIYELNKINKYLLFSFFILLLLIFRKIIHYLSKFYYNKETRIDIALLIVFFGILWLPMSNISEAEKSEQENRKICYNNKLLFIW